MHWKLVGAMIVLLISSTQASAPVLTRSYDNGRTGANTSETVFTPQRVESKGLKRSKSLKIDEIGRAHV